MIVHFFEHTIVNINMVTWAVFLMNVPYFWGVDTGHDSNENKISFKAVCNSAFYPLLWAIHHTLFCRDFMKQFMRDYLLIKSDRIICVLFIYTSITLWYLSISNWSKDEPIGGGMFWNINIEIVSKYVGFGYFEYIEYFFNHFGTIISMYGAYYSLHKLQQGSESLFADELFTGSVYGIVRHPIVFCQVCALWLTPKMTKQRLIWSIIWTIYALIGIQFEERTLVKKYGQAYIKYQKNVPQFYPNIAMLFQTGNNIDKNN